MSGISDWKCDRRSFLKLAAISTGFSISELYFPREARGNGQNTKKVKVVPDMTGIVALQYIFNQAGIKDNVGNVEARRYFKVDAGEHSPKKIYENTNSEIVTLSDQVNWGVKEDKRFKHRELVERGPTKIDYIFPGDNLILDVGSMPGEFRDAIMKRFSKDTIDISKESLEDFVDKSDFHKSLVEKQKENIWAMDISKQRKDRYMEMSNLEFIARMINSSVGDEMYSGLKKQGVKFFSPEEHKCLLEHSNDAVEAHNHKDDLTGPLYYLGLVFIRPDWVIDKFPYMSRMKDRVGNFGITPLDKGKGEKGIGNVIDIQIKASKEELIEVIGKYKYSEVRDRAVYRRTRTSDERSRYFGKIEYDKVFGIDDKTARILSALGERSFIIDTANGANVKYHLTNERGETVFKLPFGNFYKGLVENGYKILGAFIQEVKPSFG